MKKIISLFLAVILVISAVPIAYATNDYTQGTQVVFEATGTESYTITVPALLAPGGSGTVTLAGTWADNRIVTVTADPTVTLTSSIKANDTKTLDVNFDGISEAGNSTAAQTFTESVSVDPIEAALFGSWNGKFNYNAEIETDPATMSAYALILNNSTDPDNPYPMIFIRSDSAINAGDNFDSDTYGTLPVAYSYTDFEKNASFGPASIMGVRPWQDEGDIVTSVSVEDTMYPIATGSWFNGFENCKTFDLAKLNMSEVPTTRYMFVDCSSVQELNLSMWDMKNVSSIDTMFSGCSSLETLNLNGWNTQSLTDLSYAFTGCTSLKHFQFDFDTSSITHMNYAFSGCANLETIDFSNFKSTSVVAMMNTFFNCQKLTGNIIINMAPKYYDNCFKGVDFAAQNLTLMGTSVQLDSMGATGTNYCSTCNGACQHNH